MTFQELTTGFTFSYTCKFTGETIKETISDNIYEFDGIFYFQCESCAIYSLEEMNEILGTNIKVPAAPVEPKKDILIRKIEALGLIDIYNKSLPVSQAPLHTFDEDVQQEAKFNYEILKAYGFSFSVGCLIAK